MLYEYGMPAVFVTFAHAPQKSPIVMYLCGVQIDLDDPSPGMPANNERMKMMTSNPVACARFFHHMVELFLTVILRVGDSASRAGLFGKTDAYYGTVEAQGRLALHLHMVVWIAGNISAQNLRDRVLENEGTFRQELVTWLQHCQKGEFSTGTLSEVRYRLKQQYGSPSSAVHEDDWDADQDDEAAREALYATHKLATRPPPLHSGEDVQAWYEGHLREADEIVFRSNVHSLKHNRGCRRPNGDCRARFPREFHAFTTFDEETGSITLKKQERWINTYNPTLSVLMRCNTDVTPLLSGTMVKAIVAYVTDYITKMDLKTHAIFEAVRMVLHNEEKAASEVRAPGEIPYQPASARTLVSRMVNALTAKQEIGGPMVAQYLLGNPDHYTNRSFKVFFWRSYVNAVSEAFASASSSSDSQTSEGYPSVVHADTGREQYLKDNVVLTKKSSNIVALRKVHDYIYRPREFENISLEEYLRTTDLLTASKRKTCSSSQRTTSRINDDGIDPDTEQSESDSEQDSDDESAIDIEQEGVGSTHRNIPRQYLLKQRHAQSHTHVVTKLAESEHYVLNYVGGALPRKDKGGHEYYCKTMLTLFAPQGWRVGSDLKADEETWEQAFCRTRFSTRHKKIMDNMNLLYECRDQAHEFAKSRATSKTATDQLDSMFGAEAAASLRSDMLHSNDDDDTLTEEQMLLVLESTAEVQSQALLKRRLEADSLRDELTRMDIDGTARFGTSRSTVSSQQPLSSNHSSEYWRDHLQRSREAVIRNRQRSSKSTKNATRKGQPRTEHHTVPRPMQPENNMTILDKTDLLSTQPSVTSASGANASLNSEKIVQTDLHCSLKPTSLMQRMIGKHTLNDEQARAFTMAATHITSPDTSTPLQMILAGHAGTGKSQVVKSLIDFFVSRNEAYRNLIMAPTGSAAAHVDGSTYHSVLCIGRTDRISKAALDKIKSRLADIDVLIIDEYSMLACTDMYSICERLCLAMNLPLDAFAGKHIIMSGDFAQLPPAGEAKQSLYNSKVGSRSSASTLRGQKASIGRALWHHFTTVVILRQSMRQRGDSVEDDMFRTGLSNMRYRACTPEDIALFRTRIAYSSVTAPHIGDPRFRNISIITALNRHRDIINEVSALRFARDHGTTLHTFFSRDEWSESIQNDSLRQDQRHDSGTFDPQRTSNTVSSTFQEMLWNLPPGDTCHMAGKLTLCMHMPVMLKSNEATELCATNGAEARVVGWDTYDNALEGRYLSTVFVELINPPRTIKLDGLPANVVPVTVKRERISCKLPNGMKVNIWRSQVPILPNFAMTDYCAQGRTRPNNPIDPRHCRTHMALYTALSRSSTLQGTLLLHDFDERKVTGAASEDLLREFRQLEILNDVTRLKYLGQLPFITEGLSRTEIIQKYQQWKGNTYVPADVHPALDWSKNSAAILGKTHSASTDKWTVLSRPVVKRSNASLPSNSSEQLTTTKRTADIDMAADTEPTTRTKRPRRDMPPAPNTRLATPVGLLWDMRNWSCAYDCVVGLLFNLYVATNKELHSSQAPASRFTNTMLFTQLYEGFGQVAQGSATLEQTRDTVRSTLHSFYPSIFPLTGQQVTSIDALCKVLFELSSPFCSKITTCSLCTAVTKTLRDSCSTSVQIVSSTLWNGLQSLPPTSSILEITALRLGTQPKTHCSTCRSTSAATRHIELHSIPPVLTFEIQLTDSSLPRIAIDPDMLITAPDGGQHRYRLFGIVYLADAHFTCRYVDLAGDVWYHDGLSQTRTCVQDGHVDSLDLARTHQGARACIIMYYLQ